jgi:LuxR family maltose regulon positive regulatory protein
VIDHDRLFQEQLLTTKLALPRTRPALVPRPHLIEQLNAGLHRKLTLMSAPAGFGKTTLLSEWGTGCDRAVAWLSLDAGDSDPIRFVTYLAAALQTITPHPGDGVVGMLRSPQPPPMESLLTILLNDMHAMPNDGMLILDDYHVLESKPVDAALAFLLEHLPPQMHLVIATREDPPLPLARLRARDQVTELRATDLRFTPDEAAAFLTQVMNLNLSAADIAALAARTEGWIAGLQLAALSMQGHTDPTRFIQSFTGSHHFVLDYLIAEVLHQQAASVQTFLLHTSILDRLCGSLCDAVLCAPAGSGQATLEYLERANLFIVPLDNERQWYRYHQLFAELLRQRLHRDTAESANNVPAFHCRASLWYEAHHDEAAAFHHALAGDDVERAASLAELAWQAMDQRFQSATWLGWLHQLPDELIRTRPVLCAQYAQALMDAGDLEASEARLRDAERWLDTTADTSERPETLSAAMIVVDEEQFRSLPVTIAMARAYNAQAQGDIHGTLKHTRRALDLLPAEDTTRRRATAGLLGLAYWASGDLTAAARSFSDFVTSMQQAGNSYFAIAGSGYLAEIIATQGRLHEAVSSYQQAVQYAAEQDTHVQQVTAHLHLGLALLYHEMCKQKAVARHLHTNRELGEQMALVDWPYRWHLAQARLQEAAGDLEAALDLFEEAQRRYVRNPAPLLRPIAAWKARIYIRQGRLPEALDWADTQGLSIDDDLSYLREFEHATLVRLLIARYQSGHADHCILDALRFLERLLQAAHDGSRMGSVIKLLILQALAHEARGNRSPALASLERALTLAEPAGYVRIFIDEGMPMVRLLSDAAAQGMLPAYVGTLLAAYEAQEQRNEEPMHLPAPPGTQLLTPREREVLQLLAAGRSNPEIATQLVIAVTTVKTHIKNIYEKLHVTNRVQAVARIKEQNLF